MIISFFYIEQLWNRAKPLGPHSTATGSDGPFDDAGSSQGTEFLPANIYFAGEMWQHARRAF